MMPQRLVIRCEECGCRQQLEREILWPQDVCLVCHGCEVPLIVTADKFEEWARAEWAKTHPVPA
jgi:hypothetical protein